MSIKKKSKIFFLTAACFLSAISFSSCSKDDNLMSQKDIVELTAKYKDTLEEITACETRITSLKEELENTPEESAYLIEEMIEREQNKLIELNTERTELEKKLGIL